MSARRLGTRGSHGCCAMAAAVLVSACVAGEAPQPAPPPSTVRALIGNAACQSDAQCATIGVGGKACGGPSAYLAWSRATTDEAALRAAAQREAATDRNAAAEKGMVSTCVVVRDPGAACVMPPSPASGAGVCRLRSTPGVNGSLR